MGLEQLLVPLIGWGWRARTRKILRSTRWQLSLWSCVFFVLSFRNIEMLEVSLQPRDCTCPSTGYTCQVSIATDISWKTNTTSENTFFYTSSGRSGKYNEGGFRVNFTLSLVTVQGNANFTSTLLVTNIDLNGTDVTCEGRSTFQSSDEDTITLCIVGPASSPTNLSLTRNSSSVVVSFHPPVYGAECVDYYTVTAISEERNVTCSPTSNELIHTCAVPNSANVNDYTFTVFSVTSGIDGAVYDGHTAFDCSIPFPENIRVNEIECGLQHQLSVSWKHIQNSNYTTIIRIHSSEGTHYENTSIEGFYRLNLNLSGTGILEIAVTYSIGVCQKSCVTEYSVEGVLTNISFSSANRTLLILSRDCIASPEDYTLVVTFINTLNQLEEPHVISLNFNSTVTVVLNMIEELIPDTLYNVSVEIVETTSDIVIDEMITAIRIPQEPDIGGAGPSQNGRNINIVVGVCTFLVVSVVCIIAVFVILMVVIIKKRQSQQGKVDKEEIVGFKVQTSIEERRYDPPTSAPPDVPQDVSSSEPPSVVRSFQTYADIFRKEKDEGETEEDKMKQVKEKEDEHMYYVLEGPTVVQSTEERVYSVVDKSKKKKKKKTSPLEEQIEPYAETAPRVGDSV